MTVRKEPERSREELAGALLDFIEQFQRDLEASTFSTRRSAERLQNGYRKLVELIPEITSSGVLFGDELLKLNSLTECFELRRTRLPQLKPHASSLTPLAWERTAADLVREDAWRRARQGETPRCEPLESEPLRDTQWLASDATIAQMVDGLKMLHIERDRNRQREVEIAEARIRLETGLEQAVTGLLDCDAPCDDCDPIRLLLPPDTLITLLPNDGRPSLLIERLPIVEHVGGEEEAREGAKARSETSRT